MKRILIIEDDENMNLIYKRMFKDHTDRYEIEFESNAEIASETIEEKNYDLIILDIIMEPMSGVSFYGNLRLVKNILSLPVLIVSVLSPEIFDGLKEINNVKSLKKPITEEQLIGKIEEMLATA